MPLKLTCLAVTSIYPATLLFTKVSYIERTLSKHYLRVGASYCLVLHAVYYRNPLQLATGQVVMSLAAKKQMC